MPRVSDDDIDTEYASFHVEGVWEQVLKVVHRRDSESVVPYLPGQDPRLILNGGYTNLLPQARKDADEWLASVRSTREPITVDRIVLRRVVPKDSPVLEDRSAHRFTVTPDDRITFTDDNAGRLWLEENDIWRQSGFR